MATVTYGSDLYGAVRKVDQTPIVTRFAMLQFLPIYPVESLYLARVGPEERKGVPLVYWHSSTAIEGLRLARVDRVSVFASYVRAVAAVPLIVGVLGLIVALVSRDDGGRTSPATLASYSAAVVACSFLVGGATYYWKYAVPEREKKIRMNCGSLLGISADPAALEIGTARNLVEKVKHALAQTNIPDPKKALYDDAPLDRQATILLLIWARGRMAVQVDREAMEEATDRLISVLDRDVQQSA